MTNTHVLIENLHNTELKFKVGKILYPFGLMIYCKYMTAVQTNIFRLINTLYFIYGLITSQVSIDLKQNVNFV